MLGSMVDAAEGLCPHVMKGSGLRQELMKAGAGRMRVPRSFITATLLEQSGVDIMNKIRSKTRKRAPTEPHTHDDGQHVNIELKWSSPVSELEAEDDVVNCGESIQTVKPVPVEIPHTFISLHFHGAESCKT